MGKQLQPYQKRSVSMLWALQIAVAAFLLHGSTGLPVEVTSFLESASKSRRGDAGSIGQGLETIKDKSQEVAEEAARLANSLENELKVTAVKEEQLEKGLQEAKKELQVAKDAAQMGADDKKKRGRAEEGRVRKEGSGDQEREGS